MFISRVLQYTPSSQINLSSKILNKTSPTYFFIITKNVSTCATLAGVLAYKSRKNVWKLLRRGGLFDQRRWHSARRPPRCFDSLSNRRLGGRSNRPSTGSGVEGGAACDKFPAKLPEIVRNIFFPGTGVPYVCGKKALHSGGIRQITRGFSGLGKQRLSHL